MERRFRRLSWTMQPASRSTVRAMLSILGLAPRDLCSKLVGLLFQRRGTGGAGARHIPFEAGASTNGTYEPSFFNGIIR